MLPAPNAPPMGVNGIQVFNEYLYYASTTRQDFRRMQINEKAEAIGEFELITNSTALDNFDLDADGTVYVATNVQNSIIKISPDGDLETISRGESSTELVGPSSCLLHGKTLYVETNGDLIASVDGFTEPGKIAAVDIS